MKSEKNMEDNRTMASKWKEIWERRTDNFAGIDMNDSKAVFLELKRIDGFDVVGGGIPYDSLIEQNTDFIRHLSKNKKITSIFDVGCGCGANLYLFKNGGLKIGGMDYSSAQIEIAKKVFKNESEELLCGEAIELPTENKYDSVISNSVFSYFPSEDYAETVLDKMLKKANWSIGLIDIHDVQKREAFIDYRRKTVENYDERYKGLHKYFYRREFFLDWAMKKDLGIEFCDSNVKGYWNNDFVFDVYFYRK